MVEAGKECVMNKFKKAFEDASLVTVAVWLFVFVSVGVSGGFMFELIDSFRNLLYYALLNAIGVTFLLAFFTWIFWPKSGKEDI